MIPSNAAYLTELHQLLTQYFNLEEIHTLCFNLNVDHESVSGDEKSSRIRELLLALGRSGRLPELIALLQQEHPHVEWPPVPDDFQLPESLAAGDMTVPANQYHVYGDLVHGDKFGGDKISGNKIIYQGLSTEEVAALVVELKQKDQPKVWDGRIPYLGLQSFRESDAQFFFGREKVVEELLVQVEASRFIVITGPSGSGKSSVARAGLFYALRQGWLDRSDSWRLAAMQPKGDPIGELAAAIDRLAQRPGAGDRLRPNWQENRLALHEQIEPLLSDDPRQRAVLLVDQFEELFTQTKNEAVRAAFIHLLTTAVQRENGRTTVILCLRSDFISQCANYPELWDFMNRHIYLVRGMDPADLVRAITLPALKVGADIEAPLVSRILEDMKGEPGVLPLMSFALRDLFEAEKTGKGRPMALTLDTYTLRGGVEGALRQHAEKVFDSFDDRQKALARTIFKNLIEVEPGRADTRRTARFPELVPAGAAPEAVAAVVAALAEEGVRLLTTSGGEEAAPLADNPALAQTTVTIAHEKLIDAWPWLRQLVDENRELIALCNQIKNDASEWAGTQDDSFLYRGGRLLQIKERWEALQSSNLNDEPIAFIQASLAQREAELWQARKRRLALVSILMLLFVGAAVAAVVFNGQAIENKNLAATAEAEANLRATSEAEAENAATKEATARQDAENAAAEAERQARIANARYLIGEGQTVYTDEPLLGLALVLEGVKLLEGDEIQLELVEDSYKRVFSEGRLFISENVDQVYHQNFSVDDLGRLSLTSNVFSKTEGFILDYTNNPGEIRYWGTGKGIPLNSVVNRVWDNPINNKEWMVINYENGTAEMRQWGSSQGFLLNEDIDQDSNGNLQIWGDASGKWLVVDYENSTSVMQQWGDGETITLNGRIGTIWESANGEWLTIDYSIRPSGSAPAEMRRWGASEGIPLNDRISWVKEESIDGKWLIIDYQDAPDEMRQWGDSEGIPLNGEVTGVFESTDSEWLLIDYENAPDEMRQWGANEGISLRKDVALAGASPVLQIWETTDGEWLIIAYKDALGEMRQWGEREGIPLSGEIERLVGSANGEWLLVDYNDAPDEIRWRGTGEGILLNGEVTRVSESADGEWLLIGYKDAPSVMRRWEDEEEILLPGEVDFIKESTNGEWLVIHYRDLRMSSEMRRWGDSEGVPLGGSIVWDFIRINSSIAKSELLIWEVANGEWLLVDYMDAPGEIRRWGDNKGIPLGDIDFLDTNNNIQIVEPPGSKWLVIEYSDGRTKLWDIENQSSLTVPGQWIDNIAFSADQEWLLVLYSNGNLLLYDISWMQYMAKRDGKTNISELTERACTELLAEPMFDPMTLEPYRDAMPDRRPQACPALYNQFYP